MRAGDTERHAYIFKSNIFLGSDEIRGATAATIASFGIAFNYANGIVVPVRQSYAAIFRVQETGSRNRRNRNRIIAFLNVLPKGDAAAFRKSRDAGQPEISQPAISRLATAI